MVLEMIEQENSNFDIKSPTDQFYTIEYNFQSDRRIGLKVYKNPFDILLYLELNFWGNLSLEI